MLLLLVEACLWIPLEQHEGRVRGAERESGDSTGAGDDSGGETADSGEDSDGPPDSGEHSGDSDDSTDPTGGWTLSGTVVELVTYRAGDEGLCVVLADASPFLLSGGDYAVVAETTVGAGGVFTIEGITEKPEIALVVLVRGCFGGGTVYPTGTLIPRADYADREEGEVLDGFVATSVASQVRSDIESGFVEVSETWDSEVQGLLIGVVSDAYGAPIYGATVNGDGASTYYMDTDGTEGMFAYEGSVSQETTRNGVGTWMVPDPPLTTYTCRASGYTFEDSIFGAPAGSALVVRFIGRK